MPAAVRAHREMNHITRRTVVHPNRSLDRSFAFSASISRSRAGAWVCSEVSRRRAEAVTSATARSNASALACDGLLKPDSFLTNCSAEAWISSSVAGGSKLNSVLMLRHIFFSSCVPRPWGPHWHDQGRSTETKAYIAASFCHRMGTPFIPRCCPVSTKQASSPCPALPTKSFNMTAAGPIPSMACFRKPTRRMPQRLPPPSAPPPSSACPAVPRRSNTRRRTANGTPRLPPAATVPRPMSTTRRNDFAPAGVQDDAIALCYYARRNLYTEKARDRACRQRPADDLPEADAARDCQGAPGDRRACQKIHRDVAVLRAGDLGLGWQRRRLAARRQSWFCPRRRAEPAPDTRPLRQQPDRQFPQYCRRIRLRAADLLRARHRRDAARRRQGQTVGGARSAGFDGGVRQATARSAEHRCARSLFPLRQGADARKAVVAGDAGGARGSSQHQRSDPRADEIGRAGKPGRGRGAL